MKVIISVVGLCVVVLAGCGGGAGMSSLDTIPGVDGLVHDQGFPSDVVDAVDSGTDVPDVKPDADIPPSDPGADSDGVIEDQGPDADVPATCTRDEDCDAPPANKCLDDSTLKSYARVGQCNTDTGECEYGFDEVPCASGCVDGVCIEGLGLLQAELTSGGLLGMTGADYTMSCVMPGWYEGVTMSNDTWVMSAGFEP